MGSDSNSRAPFPAGGTVRHKMRTMLTVWQSRASLCVRLGLLFFETLFFDFFSTRERALLRPPTAVLKSAYLLCFLTKTNPSLPGSVLYVYLFVFWIPHKR